MTPVSVAEVFLSLAMPADRAAATAGDFAESAREPFDLWWHVTRTAVAQVIAQWTAEPMGIAGKAFLLWMMMVSGTAMLAIGAWLGWAVLYLLGHHTGLELIVDVPLTPPAQLTFWVCTAVLPAVAGWKLGNGASKMWPGRELAIWTGVLIVWSCLSVWGKMPAAMLILPPLTFLAGVWRTRMNGGLGRAA